MLLQTIAMCFHYNSPLTFQIMEQGQYTANIFVVWLQNMPYFKHDFEFRRIIFGLTSILKTPVVNIPQIVLQRLQEIVR